MSLLQTKKINFRYLGNFRGVPNIILLQWFKKIKAGTYKKKKQNKKQTNTKKPHHQAKPQQTNTKTQTFPPLHFLGKHTNSQNNFRDSYFSII